VAEFPEDVAEDSGERDGVGGGEVEAEDEGAEFLLGDFR
jgi:hypothetical protein